MSRYERSSCLVFISCSCFVHFLPEINIEIFNSTLAGNYSVHPQLQRSRSFGEVRELWRDNSTLLPQSFYGNSLPSGSDLLATHRFMQLLSYHLLREAFPAHVISSLAFTLFFFIALFHFKYFIINCVLFIFSLPPWGCKLCGSRDLFCSLLYLNT